MAPDVATMATTGTSFPSTVTTTVTSTTTTTTHSSTLAPNSTEQETQAEEVVSAEKLVAESTTPGGEDFPEIGSGGSPPKPTHDWAEDLNTISDRPQVTPKGELYLSILLLSLTFKLRSISVEYNWYRVYQHSGLLSFDLSCLYSFQVCKEINIIITKYIPSCYL